MRNLIYITIFIVSVSCLNNEADNSGKKQTEELEKSSAQKDELSDQEKISKMYELLESLPKDETVYNDFKFFIEHVVVDGKIVEDSVQKYKDIYFDCLTHLQQGVKSNLDEANKALDKIK
jgi:hypothetical protein